MILIQVNFSYFSSFQARNSLLIFHKRWFGSVAPRLGSGASKPLVVVGWTTDELAISLELVGGEGLGLGKTSKDRASRWPLF